MPSIDFGSFEIKATRIFSPLILHNSIYIININHTTPTLLNILEYVFK